MFCPYCLKEINQEVNYCQNCEKHINKPLLKQPTSTIAFGIISIVLSQTSFCFYGIILGIIGTIFGSKCKKITNTPLVLSIIGMIISIINFASILLVLMIYYGIYFLYFLILVLALVFGEDVVNYPLPDQFFI